MKYLPYLLVLILCFSEEAIQSISFKPYEISSDGKYRYLSLTGLSNSGKVVGTKDESHFIWDLHNDMTFLPIADILGSPKINNKNQITGLFKK